MSCTFIRTESLSSRIALSPEERLPRHFLNMQARLPHTDFQKGRAAFTLIELLVVMSIIGMLAMITLPALASLNNSGSVNRAVSGIPLLLDQARAYAMAHNTYVWVGFASDSPSQQLVVGAVSGTTGDAGDLNTGALVPVSRPLVFDRLAVQEINGLNGAASGATDILTSKIGTFQQKADGATVVFTNVMQFGPDGDVAIDKTLGSSHWVQIGLQPVRGANASDPNVAVIQVATLTGQVRLFRP